MKDCYQGKIWKFGNNVSTDLIHPAVYFSLDRERVKKGLFKGFDSELVEKISAGDIIVGGTNFGCGSSREVVVQSIHYNNIEIILADSFARIFYRNCINNHIIAVEYSGISSFVENNDYLSINLKENQINNLTKNTELVSEKQLVDPYLRDILEKGGLLAKLKQELLDGKRLR
ncbi:MAG: 3-isopropylmalate dehydratase [Candidatus Woesearchaeota archaeon]